MSGHQKAKLWVRCIGIAILFGLVYGCGAYALAPGGEYENYAGEWLDYSMQGVHHDWHNYLWFVQVPKLWPALLSLGLFDGSFRAIALVIPAAIVATVFSRFLPSLGARLIKFSATILWTCVVLLGFLSGVLSTIVDGRTPGNP